MTILLQAIEVKHERRVRLVFTHALASGAFGIPAPSGYTIISDDGIATAPTIIEAYIVPNSPAVVELAFNYPIVQGAEYRISAIGIPATDSSVTDSNQFLDFRWGFNIPQTNVEPSRRNRELLLYGIDLLWNGLDFQETATGDLDRISGTPNVTKALNNAAQTNPGELPWDVSWGSGLREFVDSPSTTAGTLRGAMSSQMLKDPRVKSVKVDLSIDADKTYLNVTPTLISNEVISPVSIAVPNDQ